jgi:putative tricarboxylic transport membrane protein
MLLANRIFAGIMMVIAGGFYIAAGPYPQDAANWPKVFSVIMVVFACGLIYDTYKTPEREAGCVDPLLILKQNAGVLALIVGISLVYLLLLETAGFMLLTPFFVGSLIWLLGYKNRRKVVMIALAITLAVWVSFELLLQIPLPEGIFDDFFRTLRGGLF